MTRPSPRPGQWRHAVPACVRSALAGAVLPFARVLLLALVLPFHTATAHVRLMHSTPAAGSRLATAPSELSLTFSEAVSVALFRLTLVDATNRAMELGALKAAANDAKTVTVTLLGTLPPGRYVVKWETGGADGHPIRGEYGFEIVADAGGRSTETVRPPPDRTPATPAFGVRSTGYVAIRTVQTVALVMLLGLLTLHLLVRPRFARLTEANGQEMIATIDRASNQWARATLTAIAAVTLARLAAQHAAFFGVDTPWSRATLGALLWNSSWAQAWWLALGATGVGLLGTHWISRGRVQGWLTLAAAAIALVTSIAMSGHAAAGTMLAVAIHALHVLGAGGWIGGLAALMLVAVPTVIRTDGEDGHATVARLMRAFSPAALGFAGLLVITGAIAAWRNVGSVAGLWLSPYGQLLLAKVALLSVVAATGAFNWRRVLPSLGRAASTSRLRGSATIELALALLVLVITAVLVATPMPTEMLVEVTR